MERGDLLRVLVTDDRVAHGVLAKRRPSFVARTIVPRVHEAALLTGMTRGTCRPGCGGRYGGTASGGPSGHSRIVRAAPGGGSATGAR